MLKLLKQRAIAYTFLLINTALWGFAAPIIKYSLNFTSPELFLFYRYCIATVVFLPIYLIYKKSKKQKTNYPLIIILALLGTPLTLLPLFYGLQLTSSIEGSILEASSPIFTILGGMLFLKETMKPKEWLGFFIAVFGTTLLTIEPILRGNLSINTISVDGNLYIILSNVVWTAFLLIIKKFKVNAIELSFFSFLISIPFFFFLALKGGSFSLNQLAIPGIIYMAVGGSIIAFWAYQEGQKRIEASEASIFAYLRPLFALPLALIWLKEPLSPIAILSLFLIGSGVFFSEKA